MFRIKGLRKYVKKHGKHFTEELAYSAIPCLWDLEDVQLATQRKVYYNVTSATLGDMMYLMNYEYLSTERKHLSKNDAVDRTLAIVQDFKKGRGKAFKTFLSCLRQNKTRFNFLKYV